jgi:hypothetical protein
MEEMVGSPEGALDVLGIEEMVGSPDGRIEVDGLGELVGDLLLLDPFESLLELLANFGSPCVSAAKIVRSRWGRVTVRRLSGLAFADKARPSSTRMLADTSLLREASFIILINFRNAQARTNQIHDFKSADEISTLYPTTMRTLRRLWDLMRWSRLSGRLRLSSRGFQL